MKMWKRSGLNSKQMSSLEGEKHSILLPELFWPSVRKKCSTDGKKFLKFETEGREFAKILRLLNRTICSKSESQNKFWQQIGNFLGDLETSRKKKKIHFLSVFHLSEDMVSTGNSWVLPFWTFQAHCLIKMGERLECSQIWSYNSIELM